MTQRPLGDVHKDVRHAPLTGPQPDENRPPPYRHAGRLALRYCAFCGRGQDQAVHMVAGRSAHICGDCALLSCEAIAESGSIPQETLQDWLAIWERVGAALRRQRGEPD